MWTDAQLLLLIVALLYLSECVVWLPPQAVLLLDAGRGRWRRARRTMDTGSSGKCLAFLPPWPWAVRSAVLAPPGFSASPDQVTGYVAAQNGPAPRPAQPDRVLTPAEAGPARAQLREIRVGGRLFARGADDATAQAAVRRLRELAALPDRPAREALLKRWAEESMDPGRAAARREEVRRIARPVEILSVVLFVWLFVIVPAAGLQLGAERILLPVFLATPLLHVPLAVMFFRAHRRIAPAHRGEGWVELVKCLLSPPMAARAAESLWLHAFEGFHPMALLLAGGVPGEREADARRELTDLAHPAFPTDVPGDARACERWHRQTLLAALRPRLKVAGLDPDALLAPPPAPGSGQAVCPRCRDVLSSELSACPACGNPLIPST